MQLTSCSLLFSRLGDPLLSLDLSTNAAQAASTLSVYNRKSFGLQTKIGDAPLPTLDTSTGEEFKNFLYKLLSAVQAIRTKIGMEKDFYGKVVASQNQGGLLTFRYSEGSVSGETPNQPVWNEAWTRTPRDDFPLTVGVDGDLIRLRASSLLAEVRNKCKDRETLQNNISQAVDASEDSLESVDSDICDTYRVCFCFRVSGQSGRVRALCWLHPEWPEKRLASAGPHYAAWLRSRMRKAAANDFLCVFEHLFEVGSGCENGQRELAESILTIADGKGEDCPLFYLAVESHSFTVADWLLSQRNKLQFREQLSSCADTPAIDTYNRWGDTALTRCCGRGGDPRCIAYLRSRGCNRVQQRDNGGNTAMHRLAASIPSTADGETVVRPVLNALISGLSASELADWLGEVNHAGERAMALVSNVAMLDALLDALGTPDAGSQSVEFSNQRLFSGQHMPAYFAARCGISKVDFLQLLSSDSGSGIGHSIAAFGNLEAAEATLAGRLGFDTWKELLTGHSSRGYTPMHAACQTGKWPNVAYLMHVMNQPPPPPSAIDLAIREHQLNTYNQLLEFVRHVNGGRPGDSGDSPDCRDAEAIALTILDRAEDCLTATYVRSGEPEATNFLLQWSMANFATFGDDASRDPVLGCVLAALRDGTAAPLRGLLQGSGADGGSGLGPTIQSLESQPELLDKLTLPGEHLGSSGSLGGLLGLALRRKKWHLAGELLPARQFDLLPACLGIMLTLRLRLADLPPDSDLALASVYRQARRGSIADVELPFEMTEALYQQAKHVFCAALERLYRGAVTEAQKGLVFNYLGGRFHSSGDDGVSGPLFCIDVIHGDKDGSENRCLFDLMLLTNEPELLALPCATDYVDLLLASPRSFCCHMCRGDSGDRRLEGPSCSAGPIRVISSLWPEKGDQLRQKFPRGCTPHVSMLVSALFNLVFLCVLSVYLYQLGKMSDPGRMVFLKVLLLLCGLSYAVQELYEFCSIRNRPGFASMPRCKQVGWYLTYGWNLVDITALIFLLVGIIWMIVLDATVGSNFAAINGLSYYFARLFLAVSFIFYCMRMLASLGYFERLGLYISITKTTFIMDVIPFLIVNAFFLASFGVLIMCLLFPGGQTYEQGNAYASPKRSRNLTTMSYITELYQRPLLAHFGEFGMDYLRQCQKDPVEGKADGDCPHPLGNKIYTRIVLFVYLLIISVVFMNVLIAKLSLTVGREDERARVIWRSFRAQLLAEFGGEGNAAPPLLLVIVWLVTAPMRLWRCVTAAKSCSNSNEAPGSTNTATAAAATATNSQNGGASKLGFVFSNANASITSHVVAARDSVGSAGNLLSLTEKAQASANGGTSPWWRIADGNNPMAPPDFREFLWFQAMQFRTVRHKFGFNSGARN